jgi:hypothetical protein
MSIIFEKVADLKFDELVSLYVIETDDMLKEIFEEKVKTPFNILYLLIKDGGERVSNETKQVIFDIFDKLISTGVGLSERYQHLQDSGFVSKKLEEKYTSKLEPDVKVEAAPEKTVIVEKPKKEKELPRRYGKDKIQKDIKEQGTPATPLQRAMIDLNDIRNLYVKLSDRGIKDLLGGGQNFTDEDCRKISAIVKTFKQQSESIINKKK